MRPYTQASKKRFILPWKGERFTRRDAAFVLIPVVLTAALLLLPDGWFVGAGLRDVRTASTANTIRVRGTVTDVDNEDVRQFGMIRTGDQAVHATVDRGRYRGSELNANNMLVGKLELDKMFAPGDRALFTLTINPTDQTIVHATVVDHYRIGTEVLLFAVFVIILVLFAGWTGAKALVSFVFTGVLLWKVLLPGFLAGWSPIPTTIAVVTLLTAAIIFMIGGVNRRGLVAFLGAISGVLLTALFAEVFGRLMHVHGAVRPFSETLLYSGYGHLDLTKIFIAGIFLASSGAVMDIAMDIAASMAEVKAKRPEISRVDLVASGFTVGRAVIGTMTTTLLLAYSGGFTSLLLVFLAQGTPVVNVLNLTYVAAEILHTLVGSFGLVLTAPTTAVIAGVLLTRVSADDHAAAKETLAEADSEAT